MIIIIWNIIKNIKITKTARKIFSQTDQKKQPCLAAKACQLRDKNQFCIRESSQYCSTFIFHNFEMIIMFMAKNKGNDMVFSSLTTRHYFISASVTGSQSS